MRRISLHVMILTLLCTVVRAQDKPATLKPVGETKPAIAPTGREFTDPTEILTKADEASKALNAAKYTAKAKGLGADEPKLPNVECTVYMEGYKNGRPEKFRIEAKITLPGSSEIKDIVFGGDGKDYYLIDHAKKIAYVDIDEAVLGSSRRVVGFLTMLEYVHDQPFSDEIKGETKELKGSEKVGSEDCYHVYVKYAQPGQEADWYFSKKDFLPRRVDRKFTPPSGGEPGGRQLIVTSLSPDPKFDKDPFKFELPAGFTKSDDFAP